MVIRSRYKRLRFSPVRVQKLACRVFASPRVVHNPYTLGEHKPWSWFEVQAQVAIQVSVLILIPVIISFEVRVVIVIVIETVRVSKRIVLPIAQIAQWQVSRLAQYLIVEA